MKIFAFFLTLAAAIALPASLWAQSAFVILRGTVRDSVQTIPYASVYLKKHPEKGVRTDQDGRFVLSANEDILPDTLMVSCVGYHTFSKPIPKETENLDLDIQLHQDIIRLEDVTVMGADKKIWNRTIAKAKEMAYSTQIRKSIFERNFFFRAWVNGDYNYTLIQGNKVLFRSSIFTGKRVVTCWNVDIKEYNEPGEDILLLFTIPINSSTDLTIRLQIDPETNTCTEYFVGSSRNQKCDGYIRPLSDKVASDMFMQEALKEQLQKAKHRDDRRAKQGK